MLSGISERIEELAARVGLGGLPAPVAVAALALAGVALVWAAVRWAPPAGPAIEGGTRDAGTEASRSAEAPSATTTSAPAEVTVHVVGAVRRPGVYRLAAGCRGEDAVKAAGGALGSAELAALNLARVLQDGEQLLVPAKGETPPGAPGAGASPAAGAGPAGTQKVDINRATAEQLDALPGVGPSTAAKIVSEREANGPYRSVEDLMRVPGIGAKKLDALKDLVTAG